MADFDSATLAGTSPATSPATAPRGAGRTALEVRPTFCPVEVDSPLRIVRPMAPPQPCR